MSIVKGDTRKPVVFRFKHSDGSAVDLTGESLVAHYRIGKGTLKTPALAVSAPSSGEARLMPSATNWDAAGVATGRCYLTTGGLSGIGEEWKLEVEKNTHAV